MEETVKGEVTALRARRQRGVVVSKRQEAAEGGSGSER